MMRKKADLLRGKKRSSKLKRFFFITLLALVCIGGAELLVCRFVDRPLYEKMMVPVREKFELVAKEVMLRKDQLWKVGAAVLEEPPEEQSAGNPAIWTDLSHSDETITKLIHRNAQEILTGGTLEIVYYCQGDEAWSKEPYGSDTIGGYGCGPTVMAMAVSSLTEKNISPAAMATWAKENGHWAKRRGSHLSIVEGAAKAYGIKAEAYRVFDGEQIRLELASGKLIVALMSRGHFTEGGHFILLRGVTLGGGILVADPSSRDRSLFVWDVQLIVDELSSSRNSGAPLWILTPDYLRVTENECSP